jgi:hypothetical protein
MFSLLVQLTLPRIARAADTSTDLLSEPPDNPNRFGASYRMGFNMPVRFKNNALSGVGHFVPGQGMLPSDPGPATGHGFNRTYDDGYNWVDSTGNRLGYTRYFGYDNLGSQLVGNSLVMHSSTSAGVTSPDNHDSSIPGFELTYSRELIRHEHWRAGLEGAFGYSSLEISDGNPMGFNSQVTSDAYLVPTFGGGPIVLPPGPYNGPFQASTAGNPVMSDSPTRTISSQVGTVAGSRDFTANLFSFRVGPYFALPLGERGAFTLSGGFAMMYVLSDFQFNETVTVGGAASHTTGGGSHDDWLPGGYVAGNLSYELSEHWGAFAGAQWMDVGQYTHTESGREAVLDLRNAVFVTLGVSFSF